jgi:hypothetical protein
MLDITTLSIASAHLKKLPVNHSNVILYRREQLRRFKYMSSLEFDFCMPHIGLIKQLLVISATRPTFV